MEFGINIDFFTKTLDIKKAAELIARAGFSKLDYTPPIEKDDWHTIMEEDLRIMKHYGLSVHQTHAPFNRYNRYGKMHRTYMDRCAEATALLGAEFMVVHGDEFDFDKLDFSTEAALDYNHVFFSPYVEFGAKSNYKVAFETVFEDWDRRRFTSREKELFDLIESYHSENAVCCWDFGHANISFGEDAPNIIKKFGKRIQCTHLHDNTGKDSHQMPMTGDIDWAKTMTAFNQIGYSGVMSVEYSHGQMPEHLVGSFIELTYKTAEHIWNLGEAEHPLT